MPITLSDEHARLLKEVVKAGVERSAEEAVDQAVRRLHSSATRQKPIHQQVDNLAERWGDPGHSAQDQGQTQARC